MGDINNRNVLPKSFYETENGQQHLVVDKKLADAVKSGIQERLDQLPAADRDAFLAMTANLAPGDVDQGKLDGVLDAFQKAAERLGTMDSPAAIYIGDIADFVARIMIKTADERRKSALENRMAAHEQAKADLDSQAAHSKAAADKQSSAAISQVVGAAVGGGVGVIGSGVSVAGNVAQIGKMGKSMASTKGLTQEVAKESSQVNMFKESAALTPLGQPQRAALNQQILASEKKIATMNEKSCRGEGGVRHRAGQRAGFQLRRRGEQFGRRDQPWRRQHGRRPDECRREAHRRGGFEGRGSRAVSGPDRGAAEGASGLHGRFRQADHRVHQGFAGLEGAGDAGGYTGLRS